MYRRNILEDNPVPTRKQFSYTDSVNEMLKTTVSLSLTPWGRDTIVAILQATFSKCILLNENAWISPKISLKISLGSN